MSRWGMISLLLFAFSLVIVVVARFLLGGWIDLLWVPLGVGVLSFISLIALEFRLILEFLTMRTTKNGMNMGVIIVMMIVLLSSVNYVSVKYDETVDVTEEKLNSLADQSQDILKKLDSELTIRVFYKGQEAEEEKLRMLRALDLYEHESSRVKVRMHNTYTDNLMAQEYLNTLPDKDRLGVFAFVDYGDKRIRIEQPIFSEEKITSAIVRATRKGSKTIYFLTNHGERDLQSEESDGISGLQQALVDSSIKVESLDLIAKGEIPKDASAVAVVGPRTALLEQELKILRDYARSGGRLFIAADPGEKHNLALLTKSLGVEFKNNYVFNRLSQLFGRSMASAVGVEYSGQSEITNRFSNNMTVFDLASEVIPAPGSPSTLTSHELVKSHESSFSDNKLEDIKVDEQRAHTLAVQVSGALEKIDGDEGSKEFAAVVFGDSDFAANKAIFQGLNRDLALNSLTFLVEEADLITIRPKQAKGTQLTLTRPTQVGVVVAGLSLPLILLVLSGVFWYRRRNL